MKTSGAVTSIQPRLQVCGSSMPRTNHLSVAHVPRLEPDSVVPGTTVLEIGFHVVLMATVTPTIIIWLILSGACFTLDTSRFASMCISRGAKDA